MEIFLSSNCKSFTGSVGRGYGYYIRSTKKGRFFSQRSKHSVPPDGHWRFIVACAQIAKAGLHIADISLTWEELYLALRDANFFIAARSVGENYARVNKTTYNAADVINLKITFGI